MLCATVSFAQQLQIDTAFGVSGYAEVGSQSSILTAPKFVLFPDGSSLYGITRINGANVMENFIVKFTPTGAVDTSFGTSGFYVLPTSDGNGPDILLTSDNKIYAVCSGTDSMIIRLNLNGTVDTTYATAGTKTITGEQVGNNAAILDGTTLYLGCNNYKIIALDANGNFVTSFGTGGAISTTERIVDLIRTVDGKFINCNQSDKITKYNANGSVDTTFATSGVYTLTELLTNNATTVKLMQDGSLLVLKFVPISMATDVIKLTPNGVNDTTFGTGGVYSVAGHLLADAIEFDSKIIISGSSVPTYNTYITALTPTGTLVSTFCTAGIYTETTNTWNEAALKIQTVGTNLYVGGRYTSGTNYTYYLEKLNFTNLATASFNNLNLVYNNPVTNAFTIENGAVSTIELFDLQAKKLAESNTNSVDMSNLSSGMYFANVKMQDGTSGTVKIIKR